MGLVLVLSTRPAVGLEIWWHLAQRPKVWPLNKQDWENKSLTKIMMMILNRQLIIKFEASFFLLLFFLCFIFVWGTQYEILKNYLKLLNCNLQFNSWCLNHASLKRRLVLYVNTSTFFLIIHHLQIKCLHFKTVTYFLNVRSCYLNSHRLFFMFN